MLRTIYLLGLQDLQFTKTPDTPKANLKLEFPNIILEKPTLISWNFHSI